MGDFYELFFNDAEVAARDLGIVLTRRGKHGGMDIPMCGVPVVRSDEYLHRLIALGHRVAVCEQMEDPAEAKKRGSEIHRPPRGCAHRHPRHHHGRGPAGCPPRQSPRRALAPEGREQQLRVCARRVDISTGECTVVSVSEGELSGELARIDPAELLLPDTLREDEALAPLFLAARFSITRLAREGFDAASAERRLKDYFGVATLDAFGSFSRPELSALAAILVYLERTQLGARVPLGAPQRKTSGASMAIDAATRANLELTRTLGGQREGSLLATIDLTVSAGGGRLLSAWLAAPALDLNLIRARHDAVGALVDDPDLRASLRHALQQVPDLPRALSRLALERAGPRDLIALGRGWWRWRRSRHGLSIVRPKARSPLREMPFSKLPPRSARSFSPP